MALARRNSDVILDSNIWIGYFLATDTHHTKAVHLVQRLKGQHIYVPEYVLLECATIIKMHSSQSLAVACIDFFLNTENITILPSIYVFTETLTLFAERTEKHLSFIDIALVSLSRTYTVETFDKKLMQEIRRTR